MVFSIKTLIMGWNVQDLTGMFKDIFMDKNQSEYSSDIEKELLDPKNGMEVFFDLVPSMVAIASEDGYFKK